MVEVMIDMRDLGDIHRKLGKLDTNLRGKASFSLCESIAKETQRRMKLRMTLRYTEKLVESLKVVPVKYADRHSEVAVTVLNPRIGGRRGYAGAQGYGYTPHWIKGSFSTKSGYTFADWLIAKGYETDYEVATNKFYFVKKSHPFVLPTLESIQTDLPNLIKRWSKNALRQAEFKA